MNVKSRIASWLLAGSAFLLVAPSAWAEGEITVGTQQWDITAPEAKYREFTDVPQGSFIYSLMLIQGKGRNQISILSRNVLQNDQMARFTWTNGARFRADVKYGQIPHNFSFTARSPYTEVTPGVLVLDDPIRQTNQSNPSGYTDNMRAYLAAAPNIPLSHRTDRYSARAKLRPAMGWSLEGKVLQQKKSGNKAYGGPFGFNSAIEIWEPIRHRTTDAEVNANYRTKNISLRAAGGVSVFENLVSTLTWDNPKRLTDTTATPGYVNGDASARGQLDLYPDNRSFYGNVALGVRLPQRTSVTGTIGVRTMKQDEDWLPYTINSALTEPKDPANALPGTKTDGKATAISADLRLATKALGPVGANARVKYYDYDNKSKSYDFPGYVRLDQVWEAIPLTSHPYGHTRTKISGDLDYQPVSRLYLKAGAEWNQRDRTLREVEKDTEVAGFGRFTVRATDRVSFEGAYRYGNRVADMFHIEEYQDTSGAFHEQPGLRRYDIANRRQQVGEAKINVMASQATSGSVRYQYTRNIFPDSEIGLRDQKGFALGLELDVHPEGPVQLVGGGGWSQYDALQNSRTSGASISMNPADNWSALLRDRNWYGYANLEWALVPDVWMLDLGYEFSWARGEYLLSNPNNSAADLPPTEYERHILLADLEYAMWDKTDVGLRYGYDNYHVRDFANQDVPLVNPALGGTANSIFLGDNALPYTAHRVAFYLRRTF